jgi:hypothetical protein
MGPQEAGKMIQHKEIRNVRELYAHSIARPYAMPWDIALFPHEV